MGKQKGTVIFCSKLGGIVFYANWHGDYSRRHSAPTDNWTIDLSESRHWGLGFFALLVESIKQLIGVMMQRGNRAAVMKPSLIEDMSLASLKLK